MYNGSILMGFVIVTLHLTNKKKELVKVFQKVQGILIEFNGNCFLDYLLTFNKGKGSTKWKILRKFVEEDIHEENTRHILSLHT